MSRLNSWLPFLKWPRPTAALMRNEVAAALTVALVMIPQSVAYAGLAGMPLIAGLYATLLPPLFAVLFSASTRLSVGPSALSSVRPWRTRRTVTGGFMRLILRRAGAG